MYQSSFHAFYIARKLESYTNNAELLPAYSSSTIEIYPYQIAAARFALRSPYLKGCILCDEGSLGKTYEALLIATQMWYEGANRLLLILPPNIIKQWTDKLNNSFTLPYTIVNDGDSLEQEALVIVTYDFAVENVNRIKAQTWDLVIFDEADCLNKAHTGQNKTANVLKNATEGAFRLLLTPTPITKDIMDIYGLIYFIDETVLPNADEFYKRYFRKPENYHELTEWVSRYAFRTLKTQVDEYVNFTNRIPYTVSYELTDAEKELYEKLDAYLALSNKTAYPQMQQYDLTLMFYHILSSSAPAFARTLDGAIERAIGNERNQLYEILQITQSIDSNGKTQKLVSILKKCFPRLKSLKLPLKTIIFTDNRITQTHLYSLLTKQGYKVLTYNGANSRDYSVMDLFRSEKSMQILIATDEAAKGLDIEFCPVVINYDLLYNAIEMEQRISRCHRQGQKSDVLVINLLSKDNFADVRIMELINKRTLQFNGIFGMSDAMVGNFDTPIDEILQMIRPSDEVQKAFQYNLIEHKNKNRHLVANTEDTLFTTFTKAVADKVTVTPQYISEQVDAINSELWQVVQSYLRKFGYIIDENTKTAVLPEDVQLPQLFYYWTGSRNKPYVGLKSYGADKAFKPSSGRITLASPIGRGVISNIECADEGTLAVEGEIKPCTIGFYVVNFRTNDNKTTHEDIVFIGKTECGKILSDEECRAIFELPVASCIEGDHKAASWLKSGNRFHELDRHLNTDKLASKYAGEQNPVIAEEIERMKLAAAKAKSTLSHALDDIRSEIATVTKEVENLTDRVRQMQAQKRLRVLQKGLLQKEESLFYDSAKLDIETDEKIAVFTANQQLTCRAVRQFVVKVTGR